MAHGDQLMSSALACAEVQRKDRTEEPLERALRAFLGWDSDIPLTLADHSSVTRVGRPDVVIFQCHAPEVSKRLASDGYVFQRRFAVLPSRRKARWLLPLTNEGRPLDGFELYKPFLVGARLMKALVLLVRATGWDGWVQHEVLLASRSPLSIERLASEVTGQNQFIFTLSLGTPGAFQKLTVQVMRPDGMILGFVKMPLTDAAGKRLSNEAEFLRRLSEFPNIRSHVPRLLFGGPWNGSIILFESSLEGATGPVRFTKLHKEFLASLHSCCAAVLPGRTLVEGTAQRWESIASRMGTTWQGLGREALRIAGRELHEALVPCGIHHGDFAPWNMRVHQGNLFVFDWESADWGAPNLWDQFHFLAQTECLLKVNHETQDDADVRGQHRALYLLYLLNSAAQLKEEEAEQLTIDYREKQILRYVSGSADGMRNGRIR
jgi:Phosphotransferase enzyme family